MINSLLICATVPVGKTFNFRIAINTTRDAESEILDLQIPNTAAREPL